MGPGHTSGTAMTSKRQTTPGQTTAGARRNLDKVGWQAAKVAVTASAVGFGGRGSTILVCNLLGVHSS